MSDLPIASLDELQARKPCMTSTTSDGARTWTERFYEISESERDALLAMARRCIEHESGVAWQAARDRLDTAIKDQQAAESTAARRLEVLRSIEHNADECPSCGAIRGQVEDPSADGDTLDEDTIDHYPHCDLWAEVKP